MLVVFSTIQMLAKSIALYNADTVLATTVVAGAEHVGAMRTWAQHAVDLSMSADNGATHAADVLKSCDSVLAAVGCLKASRNADVETFTNWMLSVVIPELAMLVGSTTEAHKILVLDAYVKAVDIAQVWADEGAPHVARSQEVAGAK